MRSVFSVLLAAGFMLAPAHAAVHEFHFGGTGWGNFPNPPGGSTNHTFEGRLRVDTSVPGVVEDEYYLKSGASTPWYMGPVGTYTDAVELDLNINDYEVSRLKGSIVAVDQIFGDGDDYWDRVLSGIFSDAVILEWDTVYNGQATNIQLSRYGGDFVDGATTEAAVAALMAGLTSEHEWEHFDLSISGSNLGAFGGGAVLLHTPIPAAGVLFVAGLAGLGVARRWSRRAIRGHSVA